MTITEATLSTASLRMLDFPKRFIIAPADDNTALTVYTLESAPASAFDAWFGGIIGQAAQYDAVLTTAIQGVNRIAWNIQDRWVALHDLEARGITLPLYTSREAAFSAIEAAHLAGLSTATETTAA